ncbi:MAG: TerB family tellurite resistance protein [Polaromonas sp.]|uniref:tellurite resistance TerB family protein n=1 Tax=Polaromonas sp. TaxID=1869339 RepID=UPI004035D473
MLKTLKDLFDSFTAPAGQQSPQQRDHALQLATAVLLVEVMRADADIRVEEQNAVFATLREKFTLADDELDRLMELAAETAKTAYDYHRFTSSLNDHFTHPQKIHIIENMWEVAYADAHLGAHENHLISKVAGLLYVTHGEYIAAKMRAREAAAPPI